MLNLYNNSLRLGLVSTVPLVTSRNSFTEEVRIFISTIVLQK